MSYSEVLTLPNLRGNLRQEVLQQVDQILADLRVEMRPLTDKYQIDVQSIVKNALHNREKELAAVEKLIIILHKEYHAGHLNSVDEELCLDRYNLDRRCRTLTDDVLVLYTSRQEIEDKINDDNISKKRNKSINIFTYVDEAYLDSLIAPYKTPKGAKISVFAAKDEVAEKKFRHNVLKAYDAKRGKLAWCVVSGQWHEAKHITVFAIFPHYKGESIAQSLFGPPDNDEGHLMGTKNGLPMHQIYAEAFRRNQMVLLPKRGADDDQGSFSRWKILFWDELESNDSMAKSGRTELPWGSKLAGRVLQFQNEFRPAIQYLFCHYCTGVLLHQRSEAPGWWRTCFDDTFTSDSTKIIYLQASLLRRGARKLGFLTEEEAVEFTTHNTFPHAPDDSDEGEVFGVADDETMDAFLADVSDDPGASPPTSPLTAESEDSMDEIEIEIDGEIVIEEEDSEEWEDVDDEYEWGAGWINVDEDVDEYADEDEDRDRRVYLA